MRRIQLAIVALSLAAAMNANASMYVSAAGGTVYYVTGSGTFGSQFTVSSSVTVLQAGIWDYLGDGLVNSHVVGIFDSAGGLLDTANVAAGIVDPLINGFRWADLATPLTLTAGKTYYVGAYYPTAPNSGSSASDYLAGGFHTIVAPFTWIQDGNNAGSGFDAPLLTSGTQGFFGPNLSTVPEPTTMIAGALLLLPFGASTLRMLRKNRTA